MYSQEDFRKDCLELFTHTDGNTAAIPEIGDVRMYESPLIGYAAADDGIFETYRRPEVIGENYFAPSEWLPQARTVISFFLPFTEEVRTSNRASKTDPSTEWLYARIEGQAFIGKFMTAVREMLEEKGVSACVPSLDERFGVRIEMTQENGVADFHADSRWSERHAAYACGLGTFGMSRGLISEKGMAGRYASVIISEAWTPTERKYTGIDDYCIKCRACVRNCPANAIPHDGFKNNIKCNEYVETMKAKYAPRYGCGKCQVGVPCETSAPGLRKMLDR